MNTDPPHENDQTHPTGGATKPQGDGALDLDVSPLKSSTTVSITEKTLVAVGDCFVKFPPHAVRKETTVELSYVPHLGPRPEGYTPVTSVLSCDPSFQGNKNVKVKLPTFCSTEKEVEAGIFTKDQEGSWKEIEKRLFTRENHFELQYRNLGKLAAFVRTDRLGDVYFNISCFLYNDGDRKFTMAFCLNDKAIENMLLHKNEKYFPTIAEMEPLSALIGDEILFGINDEQQMLSTKFVVDEKFVSSYQEHVSYCTINNDAVNPQYFITHKRQGRVVKKKAYNIDRRDPVKEVETDRIPTQGNECQKSGIESDSTPEMDENGKGNKAKPKGRSQEPSTLSEHDRNDAKNQRSITNVFNIGSFKGTLSVENQDVNHDGGATGQQGDATGVSNDPPTDKDPESQMKPPKEAQGKHVMLSYQHDSKEIMMRLYKYLCDKGFRIWIDQHDVKDKIIEDMAAGVENAAIIVMGITKKFQESGPCREEVTYARKKRIKMLPLKLKDEYPTEGWLAIILDSVKYVDLTKGNESNKFEEILLCIKQRVPDWEKSLFIPQ